MELFYPFFTVENLLALAQLVFAFPCNKVLQKIAVTCWQLALLNYGKNHN